MDSPETPQAGHAPAPLIKAAEKVLRALVRLLLHHRFAFPQLAALLKAVYVDVAERDFRIRDDRPSDSRITLLTGVHRKDVRRLREQGADPAAAPASVSTGARLIARWLGDSDFAGPDGAPRPLPLKSSEGGGAGFDELVDRVFKQDLRPRVILDEWRRLGIARIEDGAVVLNTGAFVPEKGFEEKAFFLGKNIQDHLNAGADNLLGRKPSHFDRSVYYDGLTAASLEELERLADTLGMEALARMNRAALALQKRDEGAPEAAGRMNFGVFNYNDRPRRPGSGRAEDEE